MTTSTATFGPTTAETLTNISRQLGEARIYLDLGAVRAARAQLEHTQALVLEMARLDAMFPGA